MYNTSVEEHRNDHDFWDHYLNQQKSTTGGLAEADLFDGGIIGYSHGLRLLVNQKADPTDAS